MSDFVSPESGSTSSATVVPYNREAEEAVIGAVLINPEAYYDVAQFLKSEDFYIHRHGWIWDAFMRLHEQRVPIDFLTVSTELDQKGQLAEIGGPAYLTALINNVPTSLHAEAYGRLVEQTAIRRKMLEAANQIAKLAYQEETGIEAVMDEAEKAVFGVSERRMTRDLQSIQQVLSDYYDRIDQLSQRDEEIYGVPTGFIDLDRLLGGLQSSDFLLIAGRPGTGKTAFLLTVAKNAALTYKKHVAIFSLEMSSEQVVQRLISQETGIDTHHLRTGRLTEEEWPLFTHAVEVLGDTRIFLDDTPSLTPLQLRTKARRLHMEHRLDLVLVDYLQLMSGGMRIENRVQEVSYISRNLKVLARELSVPVMAAAQLSRAIEQRADKEPQLSDLRESGCLVGDTRITMADSGLVVPIRELVGKDNIIVWALNQETLKLEKTPVARAFMTGIKTVYKITTRLGRSVRATANHRFLTIHGWKRLDELILGEHIALPRIISGPDAQTMTNSELAFLGHLLGDGCTLPRHAIQYTTRETDLAELVASLAKDVFGDAVNPRIMRERQWFQVYLSSTRHHTHHIRNAISEWLGQLGIFGLRSYEKYIPGKVFAQPAEAIALFLRHLWATDGSIQLVKGKKIRPLAYYATSSIQLAHDVQALLIRLGINAILREVPQNGKGRNQYNVTITGKPDLERFANIVGAVGSYKKGRLLEVTNYLQEHHANTNRDVIPYDIWRQYVVPAMNRIGMTTRQMQAKIDTNYCGTGLYKQNVSRARAVKVSQAVHSDELSVLAQSDIYWDTITTVESEGEEQVYDITVPGNHNFVADNLIVHNSLEQDADIVMFINRPELYEKDTMKQNLAQIKVSKHRNGPVGTIELVFRSNLTRFENAATRQVDLSQVK